KYREEKMSVAKNIEISSTSNTSFEDAIKKGIERATQSVKNVRGAWIKEQEVKIENNSVSEYQVTMILTFVLDGEDIENRSNMQ
ncbi:MAG TPA: dodecin family protein, partial [Pyrinomonadaceae bacterium]|nr:dodecin family protein [Pyrinomonadaceae bacterium]